MLTMIFIWMKQAQVLQIYMYHLIQLDFLDTFLFRL